VYVKITIISSRHYYYYPVLLLSFQLVCVFNILNTISTAVQ